MRKWKDQHLTNGPGRISDMALNQSVASCQLEMKWLSKNIYYIMSLNVALTLTGYRHIIRLSWIVVYTIRLALFYSNINDILYRIHRQAQYKNFISDFLLLFYVLCSGRWGSWFLTISYLLSLFINSHFCYPFSDLFHHPFTS